MGEAAVVLREHVLRKHMGPGNHPSGSSQDVHGRHAGLSAAVSEWESTKPWTWTAEQFAQTPGWELYDSESDRPVVASNRNDRIAIWSKFFSLDESARRYTLYHEVGHDVASSILADKTSNWQEVLRPFASEWPLTVKTKYELRYGGFPRSEKGTPLWEWGQNIEETLSDVYVFSLLSPSFLTYEDSKWNEYGQQVKNLVRAHAVHLGLPVTLDKHLGPGDHPSGTPQDVHGGSRLHVTHGEGVRSGQRIDKFLTDSSGNEIPFSFTALSRATTVITPSGPLSIDSDKLDTIRDRILATAKGYKLSPKAIDAHLALIWDSAQARYAADPSLLTSDRFYEMWHESLFALSEETGISFDRQIAAAAIISPGQNAVSNLVYTHDLARYVAEDPTWVGREKAQLAKVLDSAAGDVLSPIYGGHHQEVISGTKQIGEPRPPPEGARLLEGRTLQQAAKWVRQQDSVSLSDLPSDAAARALHWQRTTLGAPEGGVLGDVGLLYSSQLQVNPQAGFSVKSFRFFADSISVLRGYDQPIGGVRISVTPHSTLPDVKTRSFFNNILDPLNSLGGDDVTVDFHTINFGGFMLGSDARSDLTGTPAFEGIEMGVRPLLADSIRSLARAKSLPPSRVQEILWAEWKRGHIIGNPTLPKTVTHWAAFDGTRYPLRRI